ncbi:ATP-binding protein, partial [Curtobacterium sp. HSID17257]
MEERSGVVGRDGELARLGSLIDRIGSEGSAVVVDGDAGVGKTTLVDAVAEYARGRGVRVLRTAGSTAESGEQYAALQLLLHPLRAGIDVLPPPQRTALAVAFRSAEGEQPSPLLAGLAALTVVSDAAAVTPLLLVVEDVHWIDTESRWALRMLARRIGQDPVVVLMTTRERRTDDDAGLERMHLGPLSAADADALLDALPRPPLGAARRALHELAQGNPLALVELTGRGPDPVEDGAVTRRLETAFAERFADLDQPTRLAVLAIALGGTATAEDAGRFVDRALGRYPDPSWIDRAVAASLLVWSDRSGLRFRHPLVQTAVTKISRPSERAAVLRALVQEHASDPVRTLWWRSELATGPDAELAAELAAHARSALATGDPVAAARAS